MIILSRLKQNIRKVLKLKFHVIYTPDTFSSLSVAITSLLLHSPYEFVLVSNGLDDAEVKEMKAFVNRHHRLQFIDLPGGVTIPHGTALNHLLSLSDDTYFCFADSDIFAISNFSAEIEPLILKNDVFSSCRPLEWTTKEAKNGYRGHNWIAPSGLPLAMTYFAVYNRQKLCQIMQQHHLSLERYMRRDQVPEPVQHMIKTKDQHNWKFNTAKLVNLIQAVSGMYLQHQEVPSLLHLGGISRFSTHNIEGTRNPINKNNPVAVDRLASRHYFYHLLKTLAATPHTSNFPPLEVADPKFNKKIIEASHELQKLYQKVSELKVEDIS